MEEIDRLHQDICGVKGTFIRCEDQGCRILQALRHLDQNVRNDERKYLIPKICKRCEMKQELVLDVKGTYCHLAHLGAYLHDCHAAAIHEILVTPAVQVKEG